MRLKDLGKSKLALLLVAMFVWTAVIYNQKWKNNEILCGDMVHLYIYLPAIFIYHDIHLNYINNNLPELVFKGSAFPNTTEDGKHHVSKMGCGYSIMVLPFFLIAHAIAPLTLDAPNGYTHIYGMFVCIGIFIYFLIALVYQRKILLHFFDERTAAFTLIAIGLGTNLYLYTSYSPGNPHVLNFCLFSILIWKTIQWHQKQTIKTSVIIGLLLGLITLIRPNDLVIVLFPLLYGIYDKRTLIEKVRIIINNKIELLFVLICFFIAILPQLIIWKIQTGSFIYYSYNNEKFYFNHPHLIDGFFSFRNGMFIYTPIMLLILPGFVYAWKKYKNIALATTTFFLINSIIVFSWWCWWYGGSFGIRAMVESYAVLIIPFGCFVKGIGMNNKIKKYSLIVLLVLFVLLNQFQTLQSQTSLLHYSDMTFKTYKLIFGRIWWVKGYAESLRDPDMEYAIQGKKERNFTDTFAFLNGGNIQNISIKAYNGKYVSADQNIKSKLIADRPLASIWETFKISMHEFGKCTLVDCDNKFVSLKLEDSAILIANKENANQLEYFEIVPKYDNKFAIKAGNGKYVKTNPYDNYFLEATSDSVSKEELFEISTK
jgi:hypothetical protein